MRCAIFAATVTAMKLGRQIQAISNLDSTLYVKNFYADDDYAGIANNQHDHRIVLYTRLSEAVKEAFAVYDALIFIMAAGIAVRMIAPHLQNKLRDPAVVVTDERARHVISLLSGHMGKANELTEFLAKNLASEAVITTATDVWNERAADVIASKLGLEPWPRENIKIINTAILAGEPVTWFLDKNLNHFNFWLNKLKEQNITIKNYDNQPVKGATVVVTDSISENDAASDALYLLPRQLIAGVGCRKGTTAEEILRALKMATQKVGRDLFFITAIASTALKATELGLKESADNLSANIYFASNAALKAQIERYFLSESAFVKKIVGVGNVAEAAALAYWHEQLGKIERGSLALSKMKYGKVTVALLWQK